MAASAAGLSPVSDPSPAVNPQFILLGDSITQNSTVSLQAYLATQYTRRFDVINRGYSGYTAPLGLRAIQKFLPKSHTIQRPDVPPVRLLTLWYGANDACAPGGAGNQHVPLDEYVASLEAITRYQVLEAQKTAIVILTPPPVDEHQFDEVNPRTAARTAEYAAACRQVAHRLGHPLVDVWKLFMAEAGFDGLTQQDALPGSKAGPPSSVLRELLWDGLHLSIKGYRLVFEELMRGWHVVHDDPDFAYEKFAADSQLCQEGAVLAVAALPPSKFQRRGVQQGRVTLPGTVSLAMPAIAQRCGACRAWVVAPVASVSPAYPFSSLLIGPFVRRADGFARLEIQCTSERVMPKRGRKARGPATEGSEEPVQIYRVVERLRPLQILHHYDEDDLLRPKSCSLSMETASLLLDHFYNSPNREFHTRIVRRRYLLHPTSPRVTSPLLLLTILTMACFMSSTGDRLPIPSYHRVEFLSLRRFLLSRVGALFDKETLPDSRASVDVTITAFMLTMISTSDPSLEASVPHWVAVLKFKMQQLQIIMHEFKGSTEDVEEYRRLCWATYIMDRHSAFSFNLQPQLPEADSSLIPRPCADAIWEQDEDLPHDLHSHHLPQDTPREYEVSSVDLFGLLIPISRILGEIMDYHAFRQSPLLGKERDVLDRVRGKIEDHLQSWYASFRRFATGDLCQVSLPNYNLVDPFQHPTVAYYALHLYHCMHILLFSRMDALQMYNDLEWQSSPGFIAAGEQAMSCANVARHIVIVDPKLDFMCRYFGTYLLQSSFIFLILAQKLGNHADNVVLGTCVVNLKVLELFVGLTNMDYQKGFAQLLRQTIARAMPDQNFETDGGSPWSDNEASYQNHVDFELSRYRWVPGFRGLWTVD
ncbi:hypothetical protein NLU13_5328 [Sarocladium strictum]|uniref:Transcription factor domain-containing protein n=1 Tax=Sarocladium strictum TaxID=5046 RepID=A0AA39GHE6_SARSR|nr:hypothetical protein NLU13_5328 [Sarocladium strictum]